MKKQLLALILTLGLGHLLYAQTDIQKQHRVMTISAKHIQNLDHTLTAHKAIKRTFKNKREFQQKHIHKMRYNRKYVASKEMHRKIRYNNRYDNGYNYNTSPYRGAYRPIRQHGHRYSKRGWILAYRYDRASFYDNEGFYYGYFNRYGYYFEDVFYRYDRYYTYQDRVRGRGLFDPLYYMPANADYYGFCTTRGYNRY